MLSISQDAATLVRTLTRDADLPDDAGVRIIIDPTHHSLSMDLARNPEPRDAIVTAHGAHVFLTQPVVERLERRTLRAEVTEARSLFFIV